MKWKFLHPRIHKSQDQVCAQLSHDTLQPKDPDISEFMYAMCSK